MSKERSQPYIGVSGVVDGYQYNIMDNFIWRGLDDSPHNRLIALGVKAVHKTQWLDIENKYGQNWYPVGEQPFAEALDDGGIAALRVAQVCFDSDFVRDPEYRKAFVERISRRGKAWLNAIQFDMLPLTSDDTLLPFLEEVKEETGHALLLQAHGGIMEELGPRDTIRELGRYTHVLDYVLFDASHGKGVAMDPEALKPFLYEGYSASEFDAVGFAVAGGLNGEVVREKLATIVEAYPDVSWDAEGQLHPENKNGLRPLNGQRFKDYFDASIEILDSAGVQ